MNSPVKPLLSKLSRQELIRLCNEKMVCAARDLAEFTKNGINASFIVALAHKCEDLEASMHHSSVQPEMGRAEREIKEAVSKICEMGRRIWSNDPTKYNDYVLSSLSSQRRVSRRANGLP